MFSSKQITKHQHTRIINNSHFDFTYECTNACRINDDLMPSIMWCLYGDEVVFFFAACRWFDGHSQKMPSHVQKKWESAPVVHFFGVLVQQYTSLFKDSLISRLFLLLFELKVTHNFGDTHLFRYKNLSLSFVFIVKFCVFIRKISLIRIYLLPYIRKPTVDFY